MQRSNVATAIQRFCFRKANDIGPQLQTQDSGARVANEDNVLYFAICFELYIP